MFDFLSSPNDADHLLFTLEKVIDWWYGGRQSDYGVSVKRLAQIQLPQPLHRLYNFAGEWPGRNYFEGLFANRDRLLPFECLRVSQGKLVFVSEKEGAWHCGTYLEGDDPPVWIRDDEGPWRYLCDSLAQFLVTFCLREILYGCEHLGGSQRLHEQVSEHGGLLIPLWLDAPYVGGRGTERLSFYLVEGALLVMDNECGTDVDRIRTKYRDSFGAPKPPATAYRSPKEYWDNVTVPPMIRKRQLETLARKHERLAAYHAEKASFYRHKAAEPEQPPKISQQ